MYMRRANLTMKLELPHHRRGVKFEVFVPSVIYVFAQLYIIWL